MDTNSIPLTAGPTLSRPFQGLISRLKSANRHRRPIEQIDQRRLEDMLSLIYLHASQWDADMRTRLGMVEQLYWQGLGRDA